MSLETMSKYAKKKALQLRGIFSLTSPFVSADDSLAQSVDRWVDANGSARRGGEYLRVGRPGDEGVQMSEGEYQQLRHAAQSEGRLRPPPMNTATRAYYEY